MKLGISQCLNFENGQHWTKAHTKSCPFLFIRKARFYLKKISREKMLPLPNIYSALLNQGMMSLNFQRFINGFKP
ncbi:hypothetical protein RintRC_1869 [Richelia intracellularis]|nr:hypothetical protein RintRC_1869 [Richelia intracellularis]